jgi:hypothetical protein
LDRLKEAGFVTDLYLLEESSLLKRYRIDIEDPLIIARKPSEFSKGISAEADGIDAQSS